MKFETFVMEDTLDAIIDYRGKTPKKSDTGIPTLSAKSVKNNYIDYSSCYYISEEEYSRFMVRGFPKKGDILLTTEAPLGMVAKLDRDNIAIAQRLLTLRGKEGILDNDYLLYFLQSSFGQHLLKAHETGTTVTGIKQAVFRKLEISLPEIKIQKKIASVLSSIDEKIALNKAINENLQEQAQAICEKWVSDHSQSIVLHPLAEIADINPDTYSSKEKWDHINYLDTSSITNGVISEIQSIRPDKEKLPSRARRKIMPNDIVYSTVRPNQLHFGIVSNPLSNMLASTGFAVIRSRYSYICSPFIYHFLTSPAFIEKMQQLAEQSTSTFPSVKPSDIGACLIPCTDEVEMCKISDLYNDIFAIISAIYQENQHLATLRDTLLPKLMNGEIDVSNLDL